MGERNETVGKGRCERLHPVDRDALTDLGQHLAETWKLVLHLAGALLHRVAQQQLAARRKLDQWDRLLHRALVGDRELADLLDLVAEELHAPGMLRHRREHVEDASAYREFPAASNHVDSGIRQINELAADARQVVAAAAGRECEWLDAGEIVGERLERRAHARDDHEIAHRGILPALHDAQGMDALADGLGTGAQALVWESLPGGELHDLGLWHHAGKGGSKGLGITAGRHDCEERLRSV